jgi:hypothetical protein
MRIVEVVVGSVLLASSAAWNSVATAPIAVAGCVKSSGITVCDQENGNTSGPAVPYPCDLDWYCYDGSTWDLGIDIDAPPPPRPDNSLPRPDVGRPGTPGNRPGGGGGIGGGGGGRR